MAEQFLYGADVVAVFQEVRGETVAEGMAGDVFGNVGLLRGVPDGFLHCAFVEMVTADQAGARVFGMARSGATSARGSMVRRSFKPLPWRTVIS